MDPNRPITAHVVSDPDISMKFSPAVVAPWEAFTEVRSKTAYLLRKLKQLN